MTSSSDRMPPITPALLTPEQRAVAAEIAAGPRGELSGPFVAALRSPEFTRRLQALGEYLRYHHTLEPRLREMAVLLTARAWAQEFEWATHEAAARAAGLASAVIDAIARGVPPVEMQEDEAILYDFFRELERDRAVRDETYARAVAAFTERGIVDLVGTVGYYGTLAMIMNVARTPPPAGHVARVTPTPMSIDPAHQRR